MKRTATILLALLAVAVIVAGCKGPEGPAGPQGPPGTGIPIDTFEGFAAGIQCATCHTPDQDTTYYLLARRYQHERSKHYNGGRVDRNGAGCARCHTTEGYLRYWLYGQDVVASQPSPINCFACHSPHARNDFSIRNPNTVTIKSNITGVPDLQFNYGLGNQCVTCHMTRNMTPKMVATYTATDSLTITSSRWYSHYGVQGQMFAGNGGYVWPGETAPESGHKNVPALQANACAMCHMTTPAGGNDAISGGHSMKIEYSTTGTDTLFNLTGCNTSGCHSGVGKPEILAYQQPIRDSLVILEERLVELGYIDPATGLVNASSGSPLKIPVEKAGALYNYFFVEHDLSKGIHNYQYARYLIRTSIARLN
jgi:hypothetical protein